MSAGRALRWSPLPPRSRRADTVDDQEKFPAGLGACQRPARMRTVSPGPLVTFTTYRVGSERPPTALSCYLHKRAYYRDNRISSGCMGRHPNARNTYGTARSVILPGTAVPRRKVYLLCPPDFPGEEPALSHIRSSGRTRACRHCLGGLTIPP
jgi:hypothetical protein